MIELIDAKLRSVRSKIRELQRTVTQLAATQNYLEQRRHLTHHCATVG